MKIFSFSIALALGAAVVLVASSTGVAEDGPRWPEPANSGIGKDQMLLAQTDTSIQKGTAAKKRPLVNVDKNGVILKGYDPVAYFEQNRAVKGSPKYSSRYEDATYYFASEADKTEFEKSPAKYAPQYGGFCAYSMRKRKTADIDPNHFLIYKGKLYVCSGAPELKEFGAKPDAQHSGCRQKLGFLSTTDKPGIQPAIWKLNWSPGLPTGCRSAEGSSRPLRLHFAT